MKFLSNSIWQELVFPISSQYNLSTFVYVLLLVWYPIILSWVLYFFQHFSPHTVSIWLLTHLHFGYMYQSRSLWPDLIMSPVQVCQGSCTFSFLTCTWVISWSKFSLWFHHKFPPLQGRSLFFVPYGTYSFTCLVTGCLSWTWPVYRINFTLISALPWIAYLFLPLVMYMMTYAPCTH